MDGGHETLLDTPGVVEHLGDWGKAVGSARGVRHDSHVGGVFLVVHSHDEDRNAIFGWGGDDSLLCSSLEMESSLLLVGEDASSLSDVVGTSGTPWDLGWVSLLEDLDGVSIDLDSSLTFLNCSLEASYGVLKIKNGMGTYREQSRT